MDRHASRGCRCRYGCGLNGWTWGLHRVTEVTRGVRVASFLWLQSMVRDQAERTMLFQLDTSLHQLVAGNGNADPTVIQLAAVYQNLVRR
jgi:PKHD-type hydroxylase